ncbi:hypothetical protein DFJ74DRAFT_667708 [Hyaloraphidium curvatum]|nr:hypothetical protein DFJ74DRAFT_667708 [Hyaloraphidium curvatum]
MAEDWTNPSRLQGRRLAAVILLLSRPSEPRESLVLAVSRRSDHTDFGLPGGKLEPREADELDFTGAALRELKEETGISLDRGDVELCFAAEERAGEPDAFVTHTFRVKEKSDFYRRNANPLDAKFDTEESGRVAFVTWDALLAGCFGDYNARLLASLTG